uniref:FAD/NAD(P)-binding domain-containing protein n=1 Tax=Anas zonorhyncha TaxID=75864 RepID=A0A8B9VEY4_9AVES
MEAAAFLSDKAAAVSVVEKDEFPFQKTLGAQVGGVCMKMLQNNGVKFYTKTELCELKGKDGKVTEAIIGGGKKIPADVVVLGIGALPSSEFLKGTSIARDSSGAILVDLVSASRVAVVHAESLLSPHCTNCFFFVSLVHANQHPQRVCCGGCGLLSCSAARRGAFQHPPPTGGRGSR